MPNSEGKKWEVKFIATPWPDLIHSSLVSPKLLVGDHHYTTTVKLPLATILQLRSKIKCDFSFFK